MDLFIFYAFTMAALSLCRLGRFKVEEMWLSQRLDLLANGTVCPCLGTVSCVRYNKYDEYFICSLLMRRSKGRAIVLLKKKKSDPSPTADECT